MIVPMGILPHVRFWSTRKNEDIMGIELGYLGYSG